jgi:hypothetical protein
LGRCCRLFANLPRLCCFSDMCENAMIMRLCTGFYAPTFHKNLWFACEAGVVCTFTKWCLIILCLLLGGSGTASYWCVRLWRENRFGAGIRRPSPRELAEIQSRRADYVEPIQPSSWLEVPCLLIRASIRSADQLWSRNVLWKPLFLLLLLVYCDSQCICF